MRMCGKFIPETQSAVFFIEDCWGTFAISCQEWDVSGFKPE